MSKKLKTLLLVLTLGFITSCGTPTQNRAVKLLNDSIIVDVDLPYAIRVKDTIALEYSSSGRYVYQGSLTRYSVKGVVIR